MKIISVLLLATFILMKTISSFAFNMTQLVQFNKINQCSYCDLSHVYFLNNHADEGESSYNHSQAILEGANLSEAYSEISDPINFSHANLKQSNLQRADLQDSDLSFTDLTGADLTGANLSGANLYHANLYGAKVDPKTQLRDAIICEAIMPDGSIHHCS